jgi:hypothetical protein
METQRLNNLPKVTKCFRLDHLSRACVLTLSRHRRTLTQGKKREGSLTHSHILVLPHLFTKKHWPPKAVLTLIQSEEQDVEAQAGQQGTQRRLPPTTQRVLITRPPLLRLGGGLGHRGPRRNEKGSVS